MITLPPGTYELESLNDEIKRITLKNQTAYFTTENYSYIFKPKFWTFGSIIETQPNFVGSQISFVHDVSIQNLLVFKPAVFYKKYCLSLTPVDLLSFDNLFHATDIFQGMFFKSKWIEKILNWTMNVDPGYKYVKKFSGVFNGLWWKLKISLQVSILY